MPAVDDKGATAGSDENASTPETTDADTAVVGFVERIESDGGPLVLALCGEIDISNADSLGAQLIEFIGATPRDLVIDLSRLAFMDSSGLAMLLRVTGGVESLALRRPSPVIRRLIEATGLTRVLPVEE